MPADERLVVDQAAAGGEHDDESRRPELEEIRWGGGHRQIAGRLASEKGRRRLSSDEDRVFADSGEKRLVVHHSEERDVLEGGRELPARVRASRRMNDDL